jgi:conjugative transfer signal peptidase TraF
MLAVNDLVVASPPNKVANLLAAGDYLPHGVPLIKRVLAIAGQAVCRKGLTIIVDGIEMGAARERDRHGRSLRHLARLPRNWGRCVFLMHLDEAASFDGRYFGALPVSSVIGRVEPLWTFEER